MHILDDCRSDDGIMEEWQSLHDGGNLAGGNWNGTPFASAQKSVEPLVLDALQQLVEEETATAGRIFAVLDILQQHIEHSTPISNDQSLRRTAQFSGLTEFCDEYFFGNKRSSTTPSTPLLLRDSRRPMEDKTVEPIESSSRPSKEEQEDERLHGDFTRWSISDIRGNPTAKLSVSGVSEAYVCLESSAVSHDVVDGVLIASMTHTVPPRLVSRAGTMNSSSTQQVGGFLRSDNPPDNDLLEIMSPGRKCCYYNVHMLECVIRPDVELCRVMDAIRRAACLCSHGWTSLGPQHAEIPRGDQRRSEVQQNQNDRDYVTTSSYAAPLIEWDVVDVQVYYRNAKDT